LLEDFTLQYPSVRRAIVDLLLGRPQWTIALLQAIPEEQITVEDIDATRMDMLINHADADVRELTKHLLDSRLTNREEVVQQYKAATLRSGDVMRGKQVIVTSCATCHRIGMAGVSIGPDIGDSAMKPALQLLADILDPNRAIDANYVAYTAVTLSGKVHQGLIRSESDNGIELLTADGKTVTILRDELDSLISGKSLMPEGFERQISVEQMADLLTYLRNWRSVDTGSPTWSDPASERP
jgi:putative heme-binding domain-containing protein